MPFPDEKKIKNCLGPSPDSTPFNTPDFNHASSAPPQRKCWLHLWCEVDNGISLFATRSLWHAQNVPNRLQGQILQTPSLLITYKYYLSSVMRFLLLSRCLSRCLKHPILPLEKRLVGIKTFQHNLSTITYMSTDVLTRNCSFSAFIIVFCSNIGVARICCEKGQS